MSSEVRHQERLDSWKEIATYLKGGIRTVHRWEKSEGLPVHRLAHHKSSSVFAYSDELDQWLRSRTALANDQNENTLPTHRGAPWAILALAASLFAITVLIAVSHFQLAFRFR